MKKDLVCQDEFDYKIRMYVFQNYRMLDFRKEQAYFLGISFALLIQLGNSRFHLTISIDDWYVFIDQFLCLDYTLSSTFLIHA